MGTEMVHRPVAGRRPHGRIAPVRLVRIMVLPVAIALGLSLAGAPSTARANAGSPQSSHGTRAQAESRAFVSRSHLSTAELIRAARAAGRRLPVHQSPSAPADIPVHPPVLHTARFTTVLEPNRPESLASGVFLTVAQTSCDKSCLSHLSGIITSPGNEGQTSSVFSLGASLSGGSCSFNPKLPPPSELPPTCPLAWGGVTFQYRLGTGGAFVNIPASAVSEGGGPVTWPAATTYNAAETGVISPDLSWLVRQTLSATGLLQIQAVFNDGPYGDTYTTSPVTVTFNDSGTGGNFATSHVGPVTVGLQSGNLSLSAADASIASYGAGLAASRTFSTLAPGVSSGFGPGWTSSVPVEGTTDTWASVSNGGTYAVLTDSSGASYVFAAGIPSGGVTPYMAQGNAAARGLTLTLRASGYTLIDPSGEEVLFTAANSNTPTYYTPSQASQPGSSHTVGYMYDETTTDASYGKLELMVAPDAALPAGTANTTACPYPASASTWSAGCRALQFLYNSSGSVSQINFESYDGTNLTSTPVAEYSYDSQGRLVQEWDPRISPNLITTYTYDETASDPTYGFLTSVSPAQVAGSGALKPWTFTYNTNASSQDYLKVSGVSRSDSRGTGTQTIDYEVPLTAAGGGPLNMDATTAGTWNQTDMPASAVAIFPATHVPASPPSSSDWTYAQITYYDANSMAVNTANYASGSWDVTTTQYDTFGDVLSTLSGADRAEALAAGSGSAAVAAELETVSQYTQLSNGSEELTATYGPLHNADVAGVSGVQQVRDLTTYTYDQGAPNGDVAANGLPYQLVTTQTQSASIGAGIPGTADYDPRTTTYAYSTGSDNIGWTIYSPLTTTTDPSGLAITHTTQYNENSSLYGGDPLVVAGCMPSDTSCSGAGTQKTFYYTAGANPLVPACGNQPVWANLVCETEPAIQPGTAGLPNLPVTTITYNVYLEPLTTTETFGSSTRTSTLAYDTGGRLAGESVATSGSGMGSAVPQTKTVYSPNTGLVTDQETVNSSGTVTADVKRGYDDFGYLNSYTDASNNLSTYTYNLAGQVTSRNDGMGTVTVGYNAAGMAISENDSQAGTLTGTYNPDGNIASQTYPGGVTGSYGYDETGTATSLSYAGTAWTAPLTDTVTPNAFGDWARQATADTATSLSNNQTYTYDNADRLASVQDAQSGQCTTRSYAHNANSDRTSLATSAPGSGGACTTASPTTQTYSYDPADRLTNSGYAYDAQGDITATPASDAGGSGTMTSTYYASGMLASQTQNGATVTTQPDPTGQRFESYTANGVTSTYHYSDTSKRPTWQAGSGTSVRYVTDINGLLAAEVTTSGVTLELLDLHGDVLATANSNSNATGPTNTYVYNEFGQAENGAAGQYGWLGGNQISSSALGGAIFMGVRVYNPSTGRFSQTDPVSGGSANAYDYALQNPVTGSDLSGLWNWQGGWYCSYTNATSFTRRCNYYVNGHYSALMALELEAVGFAAIILSWIPVLFPLAWLGMWATAIAGWIDYLNWRNGGGGIIIAEWEVRLVWWWWGYHHSPWQIDGVWIFGQ